MEIETANKEIEYQWLEVPKAFVNQLNDVEAALFLFYAIRETAQIEGRYGAGAYFYKSHDSWYRLLKIDSQKIEEIINQLRKLGLIRTKLHKVNGHPLHHIRTETKEVMKLFDD